MPYTGHEMDIREEETLYSISALAPATYCENKRSTELSGTFLPMN